MPNIDVNNLEIQHIHHFRIPLPGHPSANIFLLIDGSHELDCNFVENRNLAIIPTNEIYNKVIGKYCKMEGKKFELYGAFISPYLGGSIWLNWVGILIWFWEQRHLFWELWLGVYVWEILNKRRIARGICFFCSVEVTQSHHWFVSSSSAITIWKVINATWMSLVSVIKSLFKWICGLCHIFNLVWNI